MTKYTINDLREGRVAVINDGTLEELTQVLSVAFPQVRKRPSGERTYYEALIAGRITWYGTDHIDNTTQSVKVFIEEIEGETKVPLTLSNCEFVRCDLWRGDVFTVGMVYTKTLANKKASELRGADIDISTWIFTFSPITEEEYVEELKKIWVSKYPEVKESDHFSYPFREGVDQSAFSWDSWKDEKQFRYSKEDDKLFHRFIAVYQNGIWAEKVTYEENAQVEETQSACEGAEPLAKLTSFKIQRHNGFGTIFKPVINFVEGVSFDGADLADVIEQTVNNYLKNK